MNNQFYHTDRMNEYPDTLLATVELREVDIPVTPLPNPGEGGPMDSGGNQNNSTNIPVTPSPDSGEGGPADNGGCPGFSSIFRPIFPDNSGSVTMIPSVTFLRYNCIITSFGGVYILDTPTGYQSFYVYLGNWMVAGGLGNGDITDYVQSASSTQTVTVSEANGYVYIQKAVWVRASASVTIVITNTASGLGTMEISDISCDMPPDASCLRIYNLSLNLGSSDVSIGSQDSSHTTFSSICHREVTPYTSFCPGQYQLYIPRTGSYPSTSVATTSVGMSANTSYALYIFNAPDAMDGLKMLVVSN